MKNIYFINGSPKVKESVSLYFLNVIGNKMDDESYNKHFINVKASENRFEEHFNKLTNADVIIFSFPLYVYCLPGILTKFLEEYYDFIKNGNKPQKDVKIYAIVNCGFPEPEINNEAIRVIKNFCNRVNLNWRFAVSIGCGPFIAGIKDLPIIKKFGVNIDSPLKVVVEDIEKDIIDKKDNIMVKPRLPKSVILHGGSSGWINSAKKNGISEKELYRRPYVG